MYFANISIVTVPGLNTDQPDNSTIHQAEALPEVRLPWCLRHSLTRSLSRQVTIENFSNEAFLKIFGYFLDSSPQNWPTLVHTCRKWRRIVFAYKKALRLLLFCTHGTPTLKSLDCWPALPIVVQYGGSLTLNPPAPEDVDNVMAALKQSDRVISISLTITTSLQERLSTIERPFSELENLVLLSRDRGRCLILSNAFLLGPTWGPRLRILHLTRIAFLELPQLLYASRNLVDLQLHEVIYPSNFSAEAFTIALSGMTQLRSLSLHFLPPTDPVAYRVVMNMSSVERVTLPSLTHFDFRGITNFLKELMARIHAPRLGDIKLTFFNKFTSDLSDLSALIEFIDRIEMHKSPRRADILSFEGNITIALTQPGTPTRFRLRLSCKPLSEQLSSMAQICVQLSAFLINVEDLRINAQRPSRLEDGLYSEGWLEPINLFTGVKRLQVSGNLSRDILHSLQLRDKRRKFGLPALHKLCVLQPLPRHAPFREAVVSLMTSRRRSGRPISVEYERGYPISELCGYIV
jgi:hypothetical protein